ncbi:MULTISPECIES: diacylglycerol kinase [unclassified Methylophilus]|jgi:diacylglycerol kinase (ATP)|uniref:diacylglycerol kinase n=1 Tax=unclassified Methylophilus TaxID=2630143 RepID=UPI00037829C5|nr:MULTISPECIES: diacylglycerol kinase [unclassified Methylophilus]HCU84837.1 diacylglycerol kinase [Methylophilus sp.]
MQNNQSSSHQESPFKGKTGFRRLINAFGYSMDGFKAAYQHEDAFRQEVWLSLVLIPLAFYLEAEALHRILMVGSVLLVMIVELLNSAVEAVVDRVSIERHALAKRAKDIGSAAVLLALINLGVVWGLILLA